MKRVKLMILWAVNVFSLSFGLLFSFLWFYRLKLDYNSEGNYFDEIGSINYDDDAVAAFGLITILLVFTGIISVTMTYRLKQKN